MRAIVTTAAIIALALTMGAVVAALTGEANLAVAATAVLVLLVAVVSALMSFRLQRAQHALGQAVASVQRSRDAASSDGAQQAKTEARAIDRIDAMRVNVQALSRELERTRAQTRELLEAHEFRVVAQLEQHADRCAEPYRALRDRAMAADAAAAVQLVALYQPVAPISPSGPPASQMMHLLLTSIDVRPRRIITVECGEQTMWLAYALPNAQIVALAAAGQEWAMRAAVARHGLAERVTVQPTPVRRPDLAHYYDNWYDPDALTGSVDLIVLGDGSQAIYPAMPVLADLLAPDGVVILPHHDDSPVESWCAAGLAEVDEELTGPSIVVLRLAVRDHPMSAP